MSQRKLLIPIILCLIWLLPVPGTPGAANELVLPPAYRDPFTGDLPAMQQRRVIRALVTYSKTDFFFRQGHARGIQVEYLHEYEKFLNKNIRKEQDKVRIVFIPVQFNELIPSLLAGKGDIAAAMLTITPDRQKKVAFATGGAMKVDELLVTHKSTPPPESLDDLAGKSLYILSQSSYLEHLEAINQDFRKRGLPPVEIEEADDHLKTEGILELVNSGVVDMTVADDYLAGLWSPVLPNIRVHEDLRIGTGNHLGWAVRKDNPLLGASLNKFVNKVKKGSLLGNMFIQRYFKDARWIKNPVDTKNQEKLTQFITLFRKYGTQYNFDYLAIMAQAYQESGLDQNRKSRRGALGVMQLLPSTAADPNVGIKDISTVENNIHAGAKYLAFLRDRYFSGPEISNEDRLAFSWAAYNAGPAKVRKMRRLAEEMGLDPNQWFSNVEIAAGQMVGRETVHYVANIFKYYIAYKMSADLLKGKEIF